TAVETCPQGCARSCQRAAGVPGPVQVRTSSDPASADLRVFAPACFLSEVWPHPGAGRWSDRGGARVEPQAAGVQLASAPAAVALYFRLVVVPVRISTWNTRSGSRK